MLLILADLHGTGGLNKCDTIGISQFLKNRNKSIKKKVKLCNRTMSLNVIAYFVDRSSESGYHMAGFIKNVVQRAQTKTDVRAWYYFVPLEKIVL